MNSLLTTLVLGAFTLLPVSLLILRARKPSVMPWWAVGLIQIVLGAVLILAAAMLNETSDGGAPKVFALFFGWAYALVWFLPWLLGYGAFQLLRRWWASRIKTPPAALSILLVGALISFNTSTCNAAKAPLSEDELVSAADHVVVGKVVEVSSKTQRSQVEKGIGIHRDRVFTITVSVSTVAKGNGIKPGDQITVMAWQPSVRLPPLPGLQGHEDIPAKGDNATFYLKRKADKTYEPLLPNGICVEEEKK